jgi:hypothetical protein
MIGSTKYQLSEGAKKLHEHTSNIINKSKYPHITNPCVTKDTQIATTDGIKLVSDLIGVPFSVKFNGKIYQSLKGFWSTGKRQIYSISTKNKSIKATPNHKFGTHGYSGFVWKRLDAFKVGDFIATDGLDEKIILITQCEDEEVFDCTIEDIHCYVSNGFLSHNCGEITLRSDGGYCVISDLVPFFCSTLDEVKLTAELAVRFLIRTNLMSAIYSDEVKRTNRIGLGKTSIHEFAWKFFGYGFRDLIDENLSQPFWNFIDELRQTAENEAARYSLSLSLNIPHTVTTLKPSGSISKLYNLTEGAHLPYKRYYLRWVQFQNNDPLLEQYKKDGYPVRELTSMASTSIVGFPTRPLITTLGMGDKLVTATEATPEEQYKWLMLLEKYWLAEGNNNISYTMSIPTDKYTLEDFRETYIKYQSQIRCCTVLPIISDDTLKTLYEYLPNEDISEEEFIAIQNHIQKKRDVEFSTDELMCAGGNCPL